MGKRTESLLFRFALIFCIFTVLTLVLSGFITFGQQTAIYKGQKEESLKQIARYLEAMIQEDGDEFLLYKNYMIEHYNEVQVPVDFTTEYVVMAGER